MPGLRVTIPKTFTDTSLPVLRDDPMLAPGSLLLVDPTHLTNPWPSGVPANSSRVPNIASVEAAALLGGSAETRAQWVLGANQASSNSQFERTGKGALHGIVSQAANTTYVANRGAGLYLPQSVLDWITANPSHAYFFSFWRRITRPSGGSSDSTTPFLNGLADSVATSNTYWHAFRSRINRPVSSTTGAVFLGARAPGTPDTAGPDLVNLGTGAKIGTGTGALVGTAAHWGTMPPNLTGAGLDFAKMPSFALMRYYLEDLTVSGRTYATVDALDLAQFQKEVSTGGGRYNSDTFSDPVSTLA